MQTAGFHQVNLIYSNLDTVRAEVLAEVQNVQNHVLDAVTNQPSTNSPQIQTANAVVQDPQMASIVTLISNLTSTVASLEQQVNSSGRGGRGGSGGRGGEVVEVEVVVEVKVAVEVEYPAALVLIQDGTEPTSGFTVDPTVHVTILVNNALTVIPAIALMIPSKIV